MLCLSALFSIESKKAVSEAFDLVLSPARATRKAVQNVIKEYGRQDPENLCLIVQEKWEKFDKKKKQRITEIFHRLWPNLYNKISIELKKTMGT